MARKSQFTDEQSIRALREVDAEIRGRRLIPCPGFVRTSDVSDGIRTSWCGTY